MNEKFDWIVCFGSPWDSPSVYTEKHLIKRFYKEGKKILWIDPIPIRNLTLKQGENKKVLFNKIFNKIKKQINFFTKVDKGFYVLKPFYFPNVEKKYVINNKLLKIQVAFIIFILNIKKFGVISSGLTNIHFIFPSKKYIFFIQISGDLYSDLRGISSSLKKRILKIEKLIFNKANLILVASKNVLLKIKKVTKDINKVIYFPHGVDFNHFSTNYQEINFFKNIKKPIIGYFGSLTHTNNQEVYIALAQAGFSVVLIGKVISDYSSCLKEKNIYFTGPVDYELLPSYAHYFDVCIMSWKPAEWINNSNPSKTMEYLALGKPVVSVSIPQLKKTVSDLIYFADTPQEFVDKCKLAIVENNSSLEKKRKERARNADWENKYLELKKLINDRIQNN